MRSPSCQALAIALVSCLVYQTSRRKQAPMSGVGSQVSPFRSSRERSGLIPSRFVWAAQNFVWGSPPFPPKFFNLTMSSVCNDNNDFSTIIKSCENHIPCMRKGKITYRFMQIYNLSLFSPLMFTFRSNYLADVKITTSTQQYPTTHFCRKSSRRVSSIVVTAGHGNTISRTLQSPQL